ncbi:UDP-4-amino-4,6-dideoxy-N-acetyl-beta-L-altrosamine transaminase [Colwellia sp. 1_MG-2023]|uniref:UDP-4-amino-4, 6-dideoxy-N-acetyl-beta-L-altrosamine transaminase n=1 Tax=Colwellia sp. 1_MG-2023 TaxID=3062649 RepID=UPI0026E41001|nr:UDP-4-amino-4,6-dideoxy-N-acetyl-beta-L-altrosamine transaminase [Colwellia sp. 1_MG-2023]MDO6444376.1 UDP-4-amino-4,6-dideoxy-N-acetyl-beta-L-altrosamine transaminase [Colwellia sp. 1_MG-2023]
MIPYGKQNISQEDINAVIEVLQSDWLTQGPKIPAFEQAVASYCNSNNAVAVSSATAALHIACLALNVGKGDIVWTTPITFVASANCALYCQATIDFVDIDKDSGIMSIEALTVKLEEAALNNRLPKVVIPVHLAGQSCDMQAIKALSVQYKFRIIEDASHAIGGQYKNNPIGSCQFSDIAVFSFHPVKIMTSAEGGMALTNDAELAEKMQLLRSHGITSDQNKMTEHSHGPWYYQQIDLGFNYRMTDIQAALGLSQLEKVDEFVKKRNQLAQQYDLAFEQTNITPLKQNSQCYSAYHLYVIQLHEQNSAKHKTFIEQLRANKIFTQVHYIPVHFQPYYQELGFKLGDFPAAETYYQRALSLPLYPGLTESEQQYVIDKVKSLL